MATAERPRLRPIMGGLTPMTSPVPRPTAILVAMAAACAGLFSPTVTAQDCEAQIPNAKRLEATQYVVAYRTDPAPVPMGKHFILQFVVCPRVGGAVPERVLVDANMPEHGHGMNYKAVVKAAGAGRF